MTASLVPVLLGTAIAWERTHGLNLWFFFLTLVAAACLHLGANIANDYFDYKSGADNVNEGFIRPFSGGSRVIQEGLLSPGEVLAGSFVFFGIAVAIGFYLYLHLGWVIVVLGLIGAASGFFYTAPPVRLVSRGIGEIFIGLNFGILMTLGAFFVQTQALDWEPVFASLPVALLISLVLFINEFPDMEGDRAAGKYTAVVRLGRRRASAVYAGLMIVTYAVIVLFTFVGLVPWTQLYGLLTVPIAAIAIRTARRHYDEPLRMIPANAGTIMTHLLTGLYLTVGYVVIDMRTPLLVYVLVAVMLLVFVGLAVRTLLRPPPAPQP